MATTITDAMIREAYRVARRVFDGELTPGKWVETLVESSGFNASSARVAVENLGHVLRGRVYKRLNNLAATEHFLGKILEDYGAAGLRHAPTALELHLDYYAAPESASMTVLVSRKLDGTEYESLRGVALLVPGDPAVRLDPKALDLHRQGSGL